MADEYLLGHQYCQLHHQGKHSCGSRAVVRVSMAHVFISAVTEAELHYGVARRPGATKLARIVEEFLLRVTVLPWDAEAAKAYGHLRAELERSGQPMGNLDMMIGAHALAAGAILVTNDRAFTRIKKLKAEDWTV